MNGDLPWPCWGGQVAAVSLSTVPCGDLCQMTSEGTGPKQPPATGTKQGLSPHLPAAGSHEYVMGWTVPGSSPSMRGLKWQCHLAKQTLAYSKINVREPWRYPLGGSATFTTALNLAASVLWNKIKIDWIWWQPALPAWSSPACIPHAEAGKRTRWHISASSDLLLLLFMFKRNTASESWAILRFQWFTKQ